MTAPARRVPARYFVLLRDALHEQGVDTSLLLRMAALGEGQLDQREAMLLPSEAEGFIVAARRLTGRTDLGFEMGRLIKMTSHDILGLGMLSCRNFDQVLRLISRHYRLMIETFTLRYQRRLSCGEATCTPKMDMPLETLRFYYEALATSFQNQVQLMLGPDVEPYDFYLSMPAPPHVARYRTLAPARFHFEERSLPGVRVVMSAELLDKPLPLADAHALQRIDERCEVLSQRLPAAVFDWGDYVRMMLREAHGKLITLDDLARHINVSARTIDRHLKKENLQFRDLSQQVRFERACELLRAPGATVAQVSLSLGFSDAANFSRAFRRVIGVSPGEFARHNDQPEKLADH